MQFEKTEEMRTIQIRITDAEPRKVRYMQKYHRPERLLTKYVLTGEGVWEAWDVHLYGTSVHLYGTSVRKDGTADTTEHRDRWFRVHESDMPDWIAEQVTKHLPTE